MRALILLPIILSGLFPAHAVEIVPTLTNPVIVTDINREGRPACGSPCERVAVIFVHGITGDQSTWTHPESLRSWPELLANDPALGPTLDVYRVDYYSQRNAGPSFRAISDKIGQKLDALLFGKEYKKIVMVCHSLGGILCRAHLLHVKNRWGHVYLSLFKSVFTLGTPTLGSGHADTLFVRYSANEQFRVLRSNQINDFLQQFNENIEEFRAKRRLGCPEILFYAGYETKKTYPVPADLIVTRESATAFSSYQKPFDTDHTGLAKPRNVSDAQYKWVSDGINTCLQGRCNETVGEMCGRPQWLPPRPRN